MGDSLERCTEGEDCGRILNALFILDFILCVMEKYWHFLIVEARFVCDKQFVF